MRFNDRELVKLGESKAELEGILHHMKPQGNDWSDWYQQPSFKERHFKLIANLLFYYRVNEPEPLGVLVLENAQVAYERLHKGILFAFSITFKFNDKFNKDNEGKHIFCCRCDDDVNRWVAALKMHSYEYWRNQYHILKTKISMKTGQDPILNYMKSANTPLPAARTTAVISSTSKKQAKEKSTFYTKTSGSSSSSKSTFYQSSTSISEAKVTTTTSTTASESDNVVVDNLIDL